MCASQVTQLAITTTWRAPGQIRRADAAPEPVLGSGASLFLSRGELPREPRQVDPSSPTFLPPLHHVRRRRAAAVRRKTSPRLRRRGRLRSHSPRGSQNRLSSSTVSSRFIHPFSSIPFHPFSSRFYPAPPTADRV